MSDVQCNIIDNRTTNSFCALLPMVTSISEVYQAIIGNRCQMFLFLWHTVSPCHLDSPWAWDSTPPSLLWTKSARHGEEEAVYRSRGNMHWKVRQGCVLLSGLLSDALLGVAVGCVLERLMVLQSTENIDHFLSRCFLWQLVNLEMSKSTNWRLKGQSLARKVEQSSQAVPDTPFRWPCYLHTSKQHYELLQFFE